MILPLVFVSNTALCATVALLDYGLFSPLIIIPITCGLLSLLNITVFWKFDLDRGKDRKQDDSSHQKNAVKFLVTHALSAIACAGVGMEVATVFPNVMSNIVMATLVFSAAGALTSITSFIVKEVSNVVVNTVAECIAAKAGKERLP